MNTSRTVGQTLKACREKRKVTVDSVYRSIKVHPKFITALENDDYSIFEGKVHAKGFLKIYAEFLDLNLNEIMALWRREYEPYLKDTSAVKLDKLKGIQAAKFSITPSFVFVAVITLSILGFFGYLFYEYKTYTGAPKLEIYYPQDNIVLNTDILDITGKTELDADVFINSQKIVLNSDGSFATSLKLKEGLNTLGISSINKLGKETQVIRTVIYRSGQNVTLDDLLKSQESSQTTQSTGSPSTINLDAD